MDDLQFENLRRYKIQSEEETRRLGFICVTWMICVSVISISSAVAIYWGTH